MPKIQRNLDHLPSIFSNNDQFMFYGSGNPDTGFTLATAGSKQVAIKAKYRQGDDIAGTGPNDPDGPDSIMTYYEVPSGFQVADPEHGVPVANPNRWAFSFDFGVVDNLAPIKDNKAKLLIDLDPSAKTKWLELRGKDVDNDGQIEWVNKKGVVVIGDDGFNPDFPGQVSENSQNFAFYQSLIDGDPKQKGIQAYTPEAGDIFNVRLVYGDAKVEAQFHLTDAADLIV